MQMRPIDPLLARFHHPPTTELTHRPRFVYFAPRLLTGVLTSLLILGLLLPTVRLNAQEDGLNLPTELYTLINEGQVQRYGLGASGLATVTPADALTIDFGIAPDGILLAYRTETGLFVSSMLTGSTQQIEAAAAGIPPFRGRGATIAWSPDGGVLAYTVEYGIRLHFPASGAFFDVPISPLLNLSWSPDGLYLAAEAEDNIWWIYRREGDTMILTSAIPSSVGLTWVAPALLMFAPAEGGLYLMDVGNRNTQSQLNGPNLLFRQPSIRRDGTVSVFAKPATAAQLPETAAYLYRVSPTDSGGDIQQISQTEVDLDGLRWAPGGTLMLALRGGVLALVDPASGQGFTLPATGVVSYGWGGLRSVPVASLPLTTAAYFIAADAVSFFPDFTDPATSDEEPASAASTATMDITPIDQLWRVSDDGAQGIPVISAEASVEQFTVAPGDTNVVYLSGGQLWVYFPDTDAPRVITQLENAAAVRNLAHSFDGQTVYYDDNSAVYSVPVAGGTPEVILTGYTEPQESPDGSALLVRIADGDYAVQIRATGELRRIGAFRWIKWLTANQLIGFGTFTVGGQAGIYAIENIEGASPRLLYTPPAGMRAIDAAAASASTIPFAVRVLLTGENENAPSPLAVIDVGLEGSNSGDPRPIGYLAAPQLSSDGEFIAGYTGGDGAVAIHQISSGAEVVLRLPSGIRQFMWSLLR